MRLFGYGELSTMVVVGNREMVSLWSQLAILAERFQVTQLGVNNTYVPGLRRN